MTVREFQEAYLAGKFAASDRETQLAAGWQKWACKDSALTGRLKVLSRVLCRLTNSPQLRLDSVTVSFSNSEAFRGRLYDSIHIHDLSSGYVLWTIDNRSEQGVVWTVWSRDNDFLFPVFRASRAQDVAAWFNNGGAMGKSAGEALAKTCYTCRYHRQGSGPLPGREDCLNPMVRTDAALGKPVEHNGLHRECPWWGVHPVNRTRTYQMYMEDFGKLKMPTRTNNETWMWMPERGWLIPGFCDPDGKKTKVYEKLRTLLNQEGKPRRRRVDDRRSFV